MCAWSMRRMKRLLDTGGARNKAEELLGCTEVRGASEDRKNHNIYDRGIPDTALTHFTFITTL